MYDTHCHLAMEPLASRAEAVLAEAAAAGVHGVITVATTAEDARAGLDLATRYDAVWCTAGVHPHHAGPPLDWAALAEIAAHERCLAWGELGLDDHYDDPPRGDQERLLVDQLAGIEAAAEPLPVVVHCREAHDDMLAVLRSSAIDPTRVVFHCFNEGPDTARKVLDLGCWISFTGIVTFESARDVAEAARFVPADRIMAETDAPWLSPEPVRKVRPNEPRHVLHVARRLASLRGEDEVVFRRRLDDNACRFFALPRDDAESPQPGRRGHSPGTRVSRAVPPEGLEPD